MTDIKKDIKTKNKKTSHYFENNQYLCVGEEANVKFPNISNSL
jgi:hypothetical protein